MRATRTLQSLLLLVLVPLILFPSTQHAASAKLVNILVSFNPANPLNRFAPSYALGGAIDGHEKGEVDEMLSAENIKDMLTAGLKPLSYRLRTELAGEAWHWNSRGRWSEPGRKQGYWVSSAGLKKDAISVSYGYQLPRRGNTLDQANADGYSRADDGDDTTYWKSNPYLDQYFTHESNSTLPQWIVVDLGSAQQVNAIKIRWAQPYATLYDVQYRQSGDDLSETAPDEWRTFKNGAVQTGRGGLVSIRLDTDYVVTQFVRVLLKESSERGERESADVRDRLGYAIRELSVGTIEANGQFLDSVHHVADAERQTKIYVSSTDPWHRAQDADDLIEQPGLDRIFKSGLTNHLPALIAVPVLYDTPTNAAAELRYLEARHYPIEGLELGEEPDGQLVDPEDYAALYIQFAAALHAVDPKIELGGPSFQDIELGQRPGTGKPSWLSRFLSYLKERGRLDDYGFTSFEWYPFDDVCQPAELQLPKASQLLTDSLGPMQRAGGVKNTPWIMTEYGYSVYGARPEIDIDGALLNADIVGTFLALGGSQAFLYGYEPNNVINEVSCTAGNNMLFQLGEQGKIAYPMPTYYAARLITQEWAKPGNGLHQMYHANIDDPLVAAYAVHRPDGQWAVMLINKDHEEPRKLILAFLDQVNDQRLDFEGVVDVYQYSRKQYELNGDLLSPRPIRDEPPEHREMRAAPDVPFEVPAYSLTVIRGNVFRRAKSI